MDKQFKTPIYIRRNVTKYYNRLKEEDNEQYHELLKKKREYIYNLYHMERDNDIIVDIKKLFKPRGCYFKKQ